jgi:hypothetical protein
MVDVNITGLATLLNDLATDQFGVRAESEIFFNVHVNAPPVFSLQVERFLPLSGPNRRVLIAGVNPVSGTVRVQPAPRTRSLLSSPRVQSWRVKSLNRQQSSCWFPASGS